MKKTSLCILTIGLLTASPGFAARVSYRELPESVRNSIQQNRRDIKRIESFDHSGKTVYEVQMGRGDSEKFLYFDQTGKQLNDPALRGERLSAGGDMKSRDLPKAVRETFRDQTSGAKIARITADSSSGKTVYDIQYTHKGQSGAIKINEDGSVAENLAQTPTTPSGEPSETAGFDRPLAATQKVDFESVPQAVKQTVRDRAGSSRIEDAERGTLDGRTVYEIAFKKDGKHHELRVAEDGSVVKEIAGTNIRFPGAMTVNEVPEPVQRAIRQQVGSGEVNDIDKKNVEGKTVYEVGFKTESGGPQHEIQIAEDGTVLGEPAGAEKK